MAIDGVPASSRRLVFRKLIGVLQADKVLKRAVKSWHVFDGSDAAGDTEPFAEGELPAVRILPFGQGASPETPVSQSSPLGIRLELAVDGYNVDDILDLWGAFEAALFPGDGARTLLSTLREVATGVNQVNLTQPAITVNAQGLPEGVMAAAGTISVLMTVKH